MHITNQISRCFGKLAKTKFPKPIQNVLNTGYVKILGLDMSEFEKPSYYDSLNELFTRKLVTPRQLNSDAEKIISPTDSLISACGKLQNDTLLQIKGMEYNIEELLTFNVSKDNLNRVIDGDFMNFYLSPKDYHRYHAPSDMQITKLIHVPGKLYPVNFKYLNKEVGLFVQNERVILECIKDDKLFYMVFVGALNVGQMVFDFEPRVETNTKADEIKVYEYENKMVSKGDCLGYFKMGSTVVMVWEKDTINLTDLTNEKVSFGTIIADSK